MITEDYHSRLNKIIHALILHVYAYTKHLPKDELYGVTSQIRRASISIMLNYTEGYSRKSTAHLRSFLEISYGSLREVKYLLFLSSELKYISTVEYDQYLNEADEIGRMLWGIISNL